MLQPPGCAELENPIGIGNHPFGASYWPSDYKKKNKQKRKKKKKEGLQANFKTRVGIETIASSGFGHSRKRCSDHENPIGIETEIVGKRIDQPPSCCSELQTR